MTFIGLNTYYRNTSGNHQRLHYPSIPGSRDTILRFPRYPPQTGEMAPSRVPSEACESRWHNA